MPPTVLLATRNPHKLRELLELASGLMVRWATLADYPAIPEVDEDQPTLEGNARKKALWAAERSGLWAVGEDTGLEVEALGGAPGVTSARYAGPGCSYEDNLKKLLAELGRAGAAGRGAAFRTVMALAAPDGTTVVEEGRLEGVISETPRGTGGFGYDPVFLVPGAGITLAEMRSEQKNSCSHRARAFAAMRPHLARLAVGALLVSALFASPAAAGRTEPGQETLWDQILASQASRGLRLGSQFMELKQYELAEKEFAKAVSANPKDAGARMLLGASYYWNGKVEPAIGEFLKAIELEPGNAQGWMLLGIAKAWKGEGKPAFEAFRKAAELDPKRADIQMNLGSIEESLGKTLDALGHFRRAVALEPRHPLYHFQLGMLYRRLGRDGETIESMREALKFFPDYEDALLEMGAASERRGEKKAAMHSFRKAVALKSRDAVARFRLGRLYLDAGDKAAAREIFKDGFHLTPEGEGGGLKLSVSYTGGRKSQSAREPEESPDKAPRPPRDPNDPLEVFARNLERIPLDQSAIMQVDAAFVPKPRLVRAAEPESPGSHRSALQKELAPDRGSMKAVRREYPIDRATPEAREKQIQKILDDLAAVMKDAPDGSDVRLGMNLTYKRVQEPSSRRADAEGDPRVSFQPRQVGNDMGLWVIGTGWMALVEEALPEPGEEARHPDDPDWWVGTGLGLATIGDGQRAYTAFERALRLDGKNELALLGRGVASVMTGDEARAAADLQEVLRINPKNRPAKDGLKWLQRPNQSKRSP